MSDRYTCNSACMKYEKSPPHCTPVNSEPVLPVAALVGESPREEFQANIILLKFRHHFSETASSSPGQPRPHKAYLGKSSSIFGQNRERQNDIKL